MSVATKREIKNSKMEVNVKLKESNKKCMGVVTSSAELILGVEI